MLMLNSHITFYEASASHQHDSDRKESQERLEKTRKAIDPKDRRVPSRQKRHKQIHREQREDQSKEQDETDRKAHVFVSQTFVTCYVLLQ
ncbi:hypothetical protein D3C72_1381840 [compost metagenome]